MNRILSIITAMLCCLPSLFAQQYKGTALHDIQGPVKSYKINSKNPFLRLQSKATFLKDGRQKMALWVFDEEGYPFAMGLVNSDASMAMNKIVSYEPFGSGRRPVAINNLNLMDTAKNPIMESQIFEYDGPRLSKETYLLGDGQTVNKTFIFTYSGEKYDDVGNWIERNVKMEIIPTSGEPETEEFVETRKITYYGK